MTLVMYAADLMSRIIRNYSRYLDPLSRRSYSLVLLGAAFLLLAQSSLDATTLPSGFAETKVAGLHDGTCMAITPDGRVLVTTQEGQVRVVKDGVLLTTPFVTVVTDTYQERGLNGIAVDPDFATNQYIYIYYTATTPTVHNRVSRFTANGDVATSGSETVILDLDDLRTDGSLSGSHNSGDMHFGLDGKLYISVGDNAVGDNAQTLSNLLGKLLRINKDGTIPTDNPFYNTATGRNRAIWAMGLRNPFTFDIQAGTGRLFINDVGLASWEEINDGIASANYGWPATEGYTDDIRYTSPIYAYPHVDGTAGGCAITGGTFYNPATPRFPTQYIGKYFFVDYCNLWINVFDPQTKSVTNFATNLPSWPLGVILAPDASIYYISHVGTDEGVYKIAYTGDPAPQIGEHPTDQLISEGETATFKVSVSGEPTLTYQWQKSTDGGVSYVDITGATSSSYTTPPMFLADSGTKFRCVVTNSFGSATSNPATLTVTTNKRPTALITSPAQGTHYNAGNTIFYEGTSTDPEDGTLPASSFTWQVDFHHHTHFHPFIAPTSGSTSGSFTIPTTGETDADVWYRIHLTVVDSNGLTQTTYRDVIPNTSTINLATSPAGLQVKLDGLVLTAPYSVQGVVGMTRQLGDVSPQTVNGITYYFDSWLDGGAETRNISTQPVDTTYTAVFRQGPGGTISANSNAIQVCDGSGTGVTTLTWTTSVLTNVEVHIDSPTGTLFASSGPGTFSKTTGKWVTQGMVFYLQNVSSGLPLTSANTLASVTINLTKNGCGTIVADPNPVAVCDGSGLGITTLTWTSTAATVEVHVDSPIGALFAQTGSGTYSKSTGKWVTNGSVFYLQDVSNGLSLTSANTLATVKVTLTNRCGTGSIAASPNPIHVCDGTGLGVTTLSWNSTGTTTVEVHIGSSDGALFAQTGSGAFSGTTDKQVTDGTVFYLQDVSDGLPLTSANTLATVTVSLTSNGCVAIVQQPSDQTVGIGQPTTFSVSASGDPTLTYQWQRNGINISGANSASYTTPAITMADSGAQFSCTVSNSFGSATSNSATVQIAPGITSQPANQTAVLGQSATFSVSASGDAPLTYQWQKNGVNVSAATSSTYTTPPATSADNGTQFSCVVGNSFGSVTSQSASLNVTVTITLTTNPGGLLVTWDGQQNSTPFSVTSIIGASHTLAVVSPQTLNGTTYLFDSWSDGGAATHSITTPGSNTAYTAGFHVASVQITQQPSNQTASVGQSATFSVSASGDGALTYQWQRNGINISGATLSSYGVQSVTSADNGAQFSCKVSSPYTNATSNSATLTVTATIILASSPAGLKLTLDGPTQTAPFSITSVVGAFHTLGILSPQTLNGFTYLFDSWSDGGAATHSISTPGVNTTYTASFRYNDAAFVSQSVPNGALKRGQKYSVSVTMKNTGTSTWTISNNYRLGSQNPQDNLIWGLNRVNLPSSVAPGASVPFSFTITAPSQAGDYNFQWKMVHDGVGSFGALTPNVVLKVR